MEKLLLGEKIKRNFENKMDFMQPYIHMMRYGGGRITTTSRCFINKNKCPT